MSVKLSIVIPNHNARSYLERCLATIASSSPYFPTETIVVDNASTDGSAAMVRENFPWARLVESGRNAGYGAACNMGAAAASGEQILFLNSDTEMPEGTLEILSRGMDEAPGTGIVAPLYIGPDGELRQFSWAWDPLFFQEIAQRFFAPRRVQRSRLVRSIVRRLQSRRREVPVVVGAAMLARRSMLEEVGLFDESFPLYFEEADLCRRARAAGWKVEFVPSAKLVHHLGATVGQSLGRTALIYRQSQIRYYAKHGAPIDRLLLRIYLRLKFWRVFLCRLAPDSCRDQREFYRLMDQVLKGEGEIGLEG